MAIHNTPHRMARITIFDRIPSYIMFEQQKAQCPRVARITNHRCTAMRKGDRSHGQTRRNTSQAGSHECNIRLIKCNSNATPNEHRKITRSHYVDYRLYKTQERDNAKQVRWKVKRTPMQPVSLHHTKHARHMFSGSRITVHHEKFHDKWNIMIRKSESIYSK